MLTSEARAARPDQRAYAAARQDRMEHGCWATTVDEPNGPCEFGDVHSSTTVVLLGDSHAEHWLGRSIASDASRGWKIVAMVKGGCPVADMPEMTNGRRRQYYENCARYREAMVRRIIALKPAAILGTWDHYMPIDGKESGWRGDAGRLATRPAPHLRPLVGGEHPDDRDSGRAAHMVRRSDLSLTRRGPTALRVRLRVRSHRSLLSACDRCANRRRAGNVGAVRRHDRRDLPVRALRCRAQRRNCLYRRQSPHPPASAGRSARRLARASSRRPASSGAGSPDAIAGGRDHRNVEPGRAHTSAHLQAHALMKVLTAPAARIPRPRRA